MRWLIEFLVISGNQLGGMASKLDGNEQYWEPTPGSQHGWQPVHWQPVGLLPSTVCSHRHVEMHATKNNICEVKCIWLRLAPALRAQHRAAAIARRCMAFPAICPKAFELCLIPCTCLHSFSQTTCQYIFVRHARDVHCMQWEAHQKHFLNACHARSSNKWPVMLTGSQART